MWHLKMKKVLFSCLIVMQFMSVIKGFMGMVRSKQLGDLDKREGLKLEKKTFQVII